MKKIIIPFLSALAVVSPLVTLAACSNGTQQKDELLITGGSNSINAIAGISGKDSSSLYAAFHSKDITQAIEATYKVIAENTEDEISGFSITKEGTESYVTWTADVAKDNTNLKFRIKATGKYNGKTYTANSNIRSIAFSTTSALTITGPTKHIEAYTKGEGWDNNPLSTKLGGQEVNNVTYTVIASDSETPLKGFSIKKIDDKSYVAWDTSASPAPSLITYRVKAIYSNNQEMYTAISENYEINFNDEIVLSITGGYVDIRPNYGIEGQDIDDLDLTLGGKPVTPKADTFSIIGETDDQPAPEGINVILYENDYYVHWTSDAVKTEQTIKYRIKADYEADGVKYTAKTGVRSLSPKKGELICTYPDKVDCVSGVDSECGNIIIKHKDAFAEVKDVSINKNTTYSIEGDEAVRSRFSIITKGNACLLKFSDKDAGKRLGNFSFSITTKYTTEGGAELTHKSNPISVYITQKPYITIDGVENKYTSELSKDGANRVEIPNFKATFSDKDGKESDVSDKVYVSKTTGGFSFLKENDKYYFIWSDSIEAKEYTVTLTFAYKLTDKDTVVCPKTITFSLTGKELNYKLGENIESSIQFDGDIAKLRYHMPWSAKIKWDNSDIFHIDNVSAYVDDKLVNPKWIEWNKSDSKINIQWEAINGDVTIDNLFFNKSIIIKDIQDTECNYKQEGGSYITTANSQELKLYDLETKKEIQSTDERQIKWSIVNNDGHWTIAEKDGKYYLELAEGWLSAPTLKEISNQEISVNVQAEICGKIIEKKITYFSYIYDFNHEWIGFDKQYNVGWTTLGKPENGFVGGATTESVSIKIFGSDEIFKKSFANSYVTWTESSLTHIKLPAQDDKSPKIKFVKDSQENIVVEYPPYLFWFRKNDEAWHNTNINNNDWNSKASSFSGFSPEFTINFNWVNCGIDHIYSHKCHQIKVV